jgi:hypothetical protein
MSCFPAALPHGFSACGVFLPFRRIFLPWGFFVRASAFFARCVAFCCCGQMLPRLVLFLLFAVRYFCRNHGRILRRQTAAVAKGCFFGLSKKPSFGSQKVVFCSPKRYLLHAERPPFRKWLFAASGIVSRQPSGQGRAVPRQGHPEGVIRGVKWSEILLLFIVRNIKFYVKVNLCPDFVSYYLSVGSNVFA